MTVDKLEQLFNKGGAKATKVKAQGSGADFSGMLDAVSAFSNTATTAANMYGGGTSSAVLSAAFSGINAAAAQGLGSGGGMASFGGASGGTPYMATGYSPGMKFASTGTDSNLGGLNPNAPVVPGTEGFSQMDMINTMNQNNLQLLELQAVMQSNMQAWNTKSNILSADHRARMAMIEKFTARG